MPTPERWLVVTVQLAPNDPARDHVPEVLLELGGLSILDEEAGLTTYLMPPPGAVGECLEEISRALRAFTPGSAPALSWRWQPNEDWAKEWCRGLRPRKVSPRFVVKPSWTTWPTRAGEVVIEIDPQMAFGTGEHATTRSCLRLLDSAVREGDRVLDIGSGSAILSIAAALTGASAVTAVEFDPDANINARENIERNGVAGRVELLEQMADASLIALLGEFDLVVANILSGVIRPLLPAFAAALRPGGRVILSGILQEESAVIVGDAEVAGLSLLDEDREDEWWSGLLQSR